MLSREKKFDEPRARCYLAEILLALQELHKRDIIFRDLKPDNVVIDEEGHALLTDFGLSKESVLDNNQAKSFCGSVAYLAPEVLRRAGHGKSIDWYLTGVLLYEMLVGIPPYFSNNKEQMFTNIEGGPLRLPHYLSAEAKDLLVQLLNRNPNKRLGAGKDDAEEIKAHAFFADVDWEKVHERKQEMVKVPMRKIKKSGMPLEEMIYGKYTNTEMEHDFERNRIPGWSFMEEVKRGSKDVGPVYQE